LTVSKPKKELVHHKLGVRDLTLTIRGSLCYRASPDITLISQALPTVSSSFDGPHTWTFRDRQLRDLTEHIWAEFASDMHPNEILEKVETLPRVWELNGFPYKGLSREWPSSSSTVVANAQFSSETGNFTVDLTLLAPLAILDPDATPKCPLCGHETKLKQLRGHVGQHILFNSQGMEDNLPQKVRVL